MTLPTLDVAIAGTTATPAAGADWPFAIASVIALAASAIVVRPSSTAARASWVAVVIGLVLAFGLLWSHRPILLVVALPVVAATAPVAVWRRVGRGPAGDVARRVAGRRLFVAIAGSLAFLSGVVLADGEVWGTGFALAGGGLALAGLLPFHRPSTELIRQSPPDLRVPTLLLVGPAIWAMLLRWQPMEAGGNGSHLLLFAQMTLWLGAFLILSGGDMRRLCSAAFLFTAGQAGVAALHPAISPAAVSSSLSASTLPLLLHVLLLAKLEQLSNTWEISELRGLAQRLPRYSVALLATLFLLAGTSVAPAARLIGSAWLSHVAAFDRLSEALQIWPVFLPHVIALSGWTRVASGLLSGPPRQPAFPEALATRVEVLQPVPLLEDLTLLESSVIAIALASALLFWL